MSAFGNLLLGGIFHAAVLFLVAAGLQLVFGVQKIVNLACGSFYALGAYFGITLVNGALNAGLPSLLLLPILLVAGLLMAAVGPPIERLLRTVYDRDESFQLLLTFALVLMFQDVLRFLWGPNPQSLGNVLLVYGKVATGDFSVPVYNLLVVAAAGAAAVLIGLFLRRTNYGRLLRATAENRSMAEALGVNVRAVYAVVFTLGTLLGTVGGALVVPTSAASLDMAIEFVIEAFAVVVIGGLGSMTGALVGGVLIGVSEAVASLFLAPSMKSMVSFALLIIVLVLRPQGIMGRRA
jgi:branched-chain amino acid transport system permease protein